jgi:hypothetical protein
LSDGAEQARGGGNNTEARMNVQSVQSILCIIALVLAVASLIWDARLNSVAVILLAVALLA